MSTLKAQNLLKFKSTFQYVDYFLLKAQWFIYITLFSIKQYAAVINSNSKKYLFQQNSH